jgi:hypothetical protein
MKSMKTTKKLDMKKKSQSHTPRMEQSDDEREDQQQMDTATGNFLNSI